MSFKGYFSGSFSVVSSCCLLSSHGCYMCTHGHPLISSHGLLKTSSHHAVHIHVSPILTRFCFGKRCQVFHQICLPDTWDCSFCTKFRQSVPGSVEVCATKLPRRHCLQSTFCKQIKTKTPMSVRAVTAAQLGSVAKPHSEGCRERNRL